MTGLAISKPWLPLTKEMAVDLPGQLGVFELADGTGMVTRIGYAGGREPFGLRSAIESAVDESAVDESTVDESTVDGSAASQGGAEQFRY